MRWSMIPVGVLVLLLLTVVTPLSSEPAKTHPDYDRQAARIDKQEADELAKLAEWCQKKELNSRARELATRALATEPRHARAMSVLAKLQQVNTLPRTYEVELLLVDGSHLRGRMPLQEITLDSEYGILRFSTNEVELVVFDFVGDEDLVIANGLTMLGRAGVGTFQTVTKLGPVNVGEHNLKQLHLIRPCEVCSGKLKIACPECRGNGNIKTEKPCPTCKGVDSKKPCPRCQGQGTITCDVCRGIGSWRPFGRGLRGRVDCPKCKGTGRIPCPDCQGGGAIICPTCKGAGKISESVVCPVCNGAKIIPCSHCKGTGECPTPEPVWPIRPDSAQDNDRR